MRAMILAAGRGERMRPLTDSTPKPLLVAGGKPLIVHLIEALVQGGFRELVVNHAHLGACIGAALGDGSRWDARIVYSPEPAGALDTGGGIRRALPLLGPAPFLVVNGDVWTDLPFAGLPHDPSGLAHLVLVANPTHRPQGDFGLDDGRVVNTGGERLTFSGIGIYTPELFADCTEERFPLAPLLRAATAGGRVSGQRYRGAWFDIGTPQRLRALDRRLRASAHADRGSA